MPEFVSDDRYVVDEPVPFGDTTAGEQQKLQLAPLESGGFVAVWDDAGEVKIQLFGPAGDPEAPAFVLTGAFGEPSVAALPTGGFVVTWIVENEYPAVFGTFTLTTNDFIL